jgi:hypothetical protein
MNDHRLRRMVGLGFVLGVVLLNIPYAILIATFEYPDILRQPTDVILSRFQAGGPALIATWLAFAWGGLPMLLAIGALPRVLDRQRIPYLGLATGLGIVAMVVQMVGLLRWVFVVPVLSNIYTDPTSSEATRAAVAVVFAAIHQYGGVVLGEHLGYAFTVFWMALLSLALLRTPGYPTWLGMFGLVASAIYSLGHGELFATVIPGFPYWAEAGLIGSLLWMGWTLLLGLWVFRSAAQQVTQTTVVVAETATLPLR